MSLIENQQGARIEIAKPVAQGGRRVLFIPKQGMRDQEAGMRRKWIDAVASLTTHPSNKLTVVDDE